MAALDAIFCLLLRLADWLRRALRARRARAAQTARDALEADPAGWFRGHFNGGDGGGMQRDGSTHGAAGEAGAAAAPHDSDSAEPGQPRRAVPDAHGSD